MLQWTEDREREREREKRDNLPSPLMTAIQVFYGLRLATDWASGILLHVVWLIPFLLLFFFYFWGSWSCELPCKFWDLGSRVWAFDFLSPWVSFHLLLLYLSFFFWEIWYWNLFWVLGKKRVCLCFCWFSREMVSWVICLSFKQKSHVSQIRLLGRCSL